MSNLSIIRPFGPSIVKVQMPIDLVNKLNNYTDTVIKNTEKSTLQDHSYMLAGQVQQEFFLDNKFMQEIQWGNFLAKAIEAWVFHDSKKKLKNLEIMKSWIVRQFKNEYNPTHFHGGHVSGVGYLKVPKHFGNVSPTKNNNEKGNLEFIHGSVNLFCKATYRIKPVVGDFYLFPNYLLHTVYPFSDTDEERRSISFNAYLDKETADYT